MKSCSIQQFETVIKDSGCQVLDVRETGEYKTERLEGCTHHPLSSWDPASLRQLQKDKPVYVLCMSGGRASKAAENLEKEGFQNVYVVEGGLSAWKQSGKPVIKGNCCLWSLERQVRFSAGFLVLLGVLGSIWWNRAFLGISIFVACGLMFAAVTNTCGMAMLLARMPWNRK